MRARTFVEQAVLGIYQSLRLERLGRADLFELLSSAEFQRIVPRQVLLKLHAIRKHGNVGAHEGNMSPRVSLQVLEELFDVARWLYVSQFRGQIGDIPSYRPPPRAVEDSKGQLKREKREALQKLEAQEARFQEVLKELAARDAQAVAEGEATRLQQELASRGAAAVDELHFDEKTTRRRLIDTMLVEAGWDVGPNGTNTDEVTQEERVEHQPTESGEGNVDYVLWDDDGQPLALIEAKRTSIDAKDGQIQARHYADGLATMYGRRPVILCTNGFELWIWDDAQGYPPRSIFGFYSKNSLQQLVFQRSHAQPLTLSPDRSIVDRLYQTNAIKSVTERFAGKRRKALLVQATGTGKTRVAIALADLMMRANWVKRVLLLCDRRELRKQARDAFLAHTPHTPVIVRASTARERHHRVYLATYRR